jgi:uncharacterized protein
MEQSQAFRNVVTSEAELAELLGGTPSKIAANKVIGQLDEHCREFISKSPFLLMATADGNGGCDVSPRGDAPGFVQVLDEHRLLIPERPGNKRADSLRNLLANPQIGLIFLIPGLDETLRINGRACIVKDADLLAPLAVSGKTPVLGIGVGVEECFIHCAKAFKRSGLWQPDAWLVHADLPSPAKILAAHCALPGLDEAEVAAGLQESYTKRLY